jgi:Arc/MetJ-type ribon-helix-helix transcriptional regulator
MDVQLKPELERFIEQQVSAGHFASRAEVLEAGLARLMLDPPHDQMSTEQAAELRRSMEQMRRGEVVDWRQFSTPWRAKYGPTSPRSRL